MDLKFGTTREPKYRLDTDEKVRNQIPTLGGNQEMTIVNESGLYAVILRSDMQSVGLRNSVRNSSSLLP
jgi:prophage antirepressor-like protein